MTMHKFIRIDPAAMTVAVVEKDYPTTYDLLREEVGGYLARVPLMRAPVSRNILTMWVEDEGLKRAEQRFFTLTGDNTFTRNHRPLYAGRGIIVEEADGESFGLGGAFDPLGIRILVGQSASFLGAASAVEHSIAAGLIDRPETVLHGGDGSVEVLWRWSAAECVLPPVTYPAE
jgi:hypothetical protein